MAAFRFDDVFQPQERLGDTNTLSGPFHFHIWDFLSAFYSNHSPKRAAIDLGAWYRPPDRQTDTQRLCLILPTLAAGHKNCWVGDYKCTRQVRACTNLQSMTHTRWVNVTRRNVCLQRAISWSVTRCPPGKNAACMYARDSQSAKLEQQSVFHVKLGPQTGRFKLLEYWFVIRFISHSCNDCLLGWMPPSLYILTSNPAAHIVSLRIRVH